jgi:hypothetical protein
MAEWTKMVKSHAAWVARLTPDTRVRVNASREDRLGLAAPERSAR